MNSRSRQLLRLRPLRGFEAPAIELFDQSAVERVELAPGFTLNDLVSYSDKHNEANGENNRDGTSNNFS